jgi:serine beta-lactamase-like protein LACTB, mitochondrial
VRFSASLFSDLRCRAILLCRCLVSIVFVFIAVTLSSAQQSKLAPEKLKRIEDAASKFLADTHTPGISIAVVENGEYEWAEGFGLADAENNVPASEHTLYRLASISKSLTATGAMELVERKKLDLDAPVQKYCPAFPDKGSPITARLVMGHLAGIRHYKSGSQDDPEVGNTKYFDDPIQAGLNFFKGDPLLSKPGTTFHYSTQGYTVVGCVIEGASGSKYIDFMKQNVFALAGMEQTQVDDRFKIIPYRTRFYQKQDSGEVVNADFLDSSYKIPGGGWLSSAEDMARFEAAILNDKLVTRPTRDLMWTPLKPSDGAKDDYGLGWARRTFDGMEAEGHDGSQQGTSTAFLIAAPQRAGVVVLANMEGEDVQKLAREVMKIVVGAK